MQVHTIQAQTLDELHFLAVRKCFEVGEIYIVERGSFEGHKRLEVPHITLQVNHPNRYPRIPQLPQGVPPVTDDSKVMGYFLNNLTNDNPGSYEYTYGQYIVPQLTPVIEILSKDPQTNQAYITVGEPRSIYSSDPPCLRGIDCRVDQNKVLHFILYFRSWDCWAGLPENLAGLQLLKEYLAFEVGAKDGAIVASSKGLHLYDYQWPIAFQRLHNTLPDRPAHLHPLTEEEVLLGEKHLDN